MVEENYQLSPFSNALEWVLLSVRNFTKVEENFQISISSFLTNLFGDDSGELYYVSSKQTNLLLIMYLRNRIQDEKKD